MLNANNDENEKKERSVVGNREEGEKKREEGEKEREKNNKRELVEKEQERKDRDKNEANEGQKNQRTREEKGKMINPPVQNLPYPHAPTKKDKERQYARFLDIFKWLQINIPFAAALEQMPTYARFMK